MERAKKYKVTNPSNPDFGKKIKAVTDALGTYTDVKTGKQYDSQELREIPEKHAFYGGLRFGRFGIFLFGREYIAYHSYQFGIGFDHIVGIDRYFDIELRIACFGVGVRFMWVKKLD